MIYCSVRIFAIIDGWVRFHLTVRIVEDGLKEKYLNIYEKIQVPILIQK
jgi:hypothetical protein